MAFSLSVCTRSKRKTAWAINTKLGTRILYTSRSAYVDQKVKDQNHTVTKTVTVARLLVMCAATAVWCCCRHGSACRYDCLRFLLLTVMLTSYVIYQIQERLGSTNVLLVLKLGIADFACIRIAILRRLLHCALHGVFIINGAAYNEWYSTVGLLRCSCEDRDRLHARVKTVKDSIDYYVIVWLCHCIVLLDGGVTLTSSISFTVVTYEQDCPSTVQSFWQLSAYT